MSEGQQAAQLSRLFEQPADAPVFYADFAQVLGTGNEVVLQFYETTPGAPGASGQIESVRSKLRATVILSPRHALNIGTLLLKHAGRGMSPADAAAHGAPAQPDAQQAQEPTSAEGQETQ